jgi:hypothetical protein
MATKGLFWTHKVSQMNYAQPKTYHVSIAFI